MGCLLTELNDGSKSKVKQQTTNDGDTSLVAALDLGGGSTQVTFLPQRLTDAFVGVDRQRYSHITNVLGSPAELYTHSYLGGGLIAARIGITKEDALSNDNYYLSECFPNGYRLASVDYAGRQWNIMGNASSFVGCIRAAERYIRKVGIQRIPELQEQVIYGISYFYERGQQVKLFTDADNDHPGTAFVGDYRTAAQEACSLTGDQIGPEHWKPWQCLDLSYIYSLLHTGYGLDDTKKIHLMKHFHDMEVSWALGASYNMMDSYQKQLLKQLPTKSEHTKLNIQKPYILQNINIIARSLTSFVSEIIS